MLKIELTQGRFAIIDKEDIDIVSKYKWFFTKNGYAMNKSGKKSIYMHRLILGVQNGLSTHIDVQGFSLPGQARYGSRLLGESPAHRVRLF